MEESHRTLLSHKRLFWGDPCCAPSLAGSLAVCCYVPVPPPVLPEEVLAP